MRLLLAVVAVSWLFCASILFASDETTPAPGSTTAAPEAAPSPAATPPAPLANLELLLDNAISRNLITGGVVVVGNHSGIIATAARGGLNFTGNSPALNEHTIFDLASLTKVVATAPAVMKLLDEGRITLSDPLSRWFPEFQDAGVKNVTVLNLLTHTSGLSDFSLHSGQGMKEALARVAAEHPYATGHFRYADINFILLAEMVRRVSGESLDAFCKNHLYAPMGATETLFLPPRELASNIAPTLGYDSGVVQDTNARRLGGVAGHAGLFSSAYDLSRYARMILGGGTLDDQRILSEQVVAQMTTPYGCNNGAVLRGLGWDIDSPFSAPRGSYFSKASFGHTGYSGSSIWIDPQQDLFVIFLTNRLEYRNVHAFNNLRRDVSTLAVASLRHPDQQPSVQLAGLAANLQESVRQPVLKLASVVFKERHSAKPCRQVARNHSKRDKRIAKDSRRDKRIAKATLHRGSRGGKSAGVRKTAIRKKHPRDRHA